MTINIATEAAIERSTYVARCTFTDEDGDPCVPSSITWSLEDTGGNTVNGRADVAVAVPSAVVDIVLSGDDLALVDQANEFELRRLLVAAVYDSTLADDLPSKGALEFKVLNTNRLASYRV